MGKYQKPDDKPGQVWCCPASRLNSGAKSALSRRSFLKGVGFTTLGTLGLKNVSWKSLATEASAFPEEQLAEFRTALKVKPLLIYDTPARAPQTSWRAWGGIQTQREAEEEMARIRGELVDLSQKADFPVEFRPVSGVKSAAEIDRLKEELAAADVTIVYAAGGWLDRFKKLEETGKELIFFCRHRSGPVYLWYEIISPRYLRQHTDHLALERVDDSDVVIDNQEELLWRLRSLCGWRNTMGTKIIAVGGPDAWSQPPGVVPKLVEEKWKFDIKTVSYDELGRIIKEAKNEAAAVKIARQRASDYLKLPGTRLETELSFVQNAFLLEEVFIALMKKAGCRAITINGCMGTIMPLAETSACLTLSLLNDAGYLAFCESDFVVIPAGVLLHNISGRPVFLNDPTYPHEGLITLAHCTAPRKMDGKSLEPARILTHFESDYGTAPKVEMSRGQIVTNIIPDFASRRWVGLKGRIEEAPFLPICRSQIEVSFDQDSELLARRMPGFHWMTAYGDYLREVGYALRRVKIEWDCL
ncbi:MAG: sugar isomerase [Candidatus Saccharicenans sp.]|uniref:sugar isomerase n=1 Tax=Candidatus Saccharicenans sp. TaxID=2819258 RepID=UPI0040492CC4